MRLSWPAAAALSARSAGFRPAARAARHVHETTGSPTLAVLLALVAAVGIGLGAVIQQRTAAQATPAPAMHPVLFGRLLRRPLWLAGLLVGTGGYAAQATALAMGRLVVVEPLLVAALPFALPVAALWAHKRLRLRDWVAGLVTAGALALFLLVARPGGGRGAAPATDWLPLLAAVTAVSGLVLALGKRLPVAAYAAALAGTAGLVYGVSDGLTKQTLDLLLAHHLAVLAEWEPYVTAAVGIVGFLFQQSAYHVAHLTASLPASSTLEPLVGTLMGVLLLQETLTDSGWAIGVEVLAGLVMIAGVVVLARSPLVTGVPAAGQQLLPLAAGRPGG